MTDAEVYREAAELVFCSKHRFSCEAIGLVGRSGFKGWELKFLYSDLFAPEGCDQYDPWGDDWGNTTAERRECRVLALCLMAAIAESEE
jgi:hypothetical protein